MPVAAQIVVSAASSVEARPRDDELDLFGLTHAGLVRKENEDQFLLCTVHPHVLVHATSLPDPSEIAHMGQRLATIMLVADGVGGSAAGSRASRIATEAVTRYVASAQGSHALPAMTTRGTPSPWPTPPWTANLGSAPKGTGLGRSRGAPSS